MVNWPLRRLMLSTFANWYVRTITGMQVRDCTAGFRCWSRDAIARLPLDRIVSDGYSFQVETLFLALEAGCTVGEVPIIFVERRVGASRSPATSSANRSSRRGGWPCGARSAAAAGAPPRYNLSGALQPCPRRPPRRA